MAKLFALLVGINAYPVKPLQGCVNDVNAVEDYLMSTYKEETGIKPHIKRLTTDTKDEKPTRDNLIKAFDHFNSAANGDTCLFYYSGHGSYSTAPAEFWTDSRGFVQSFVCSDSRNPGGRDLMDKEMGFLIWKATVNNPDANFVVITDCCHSGTITKNIDDSGITDRMYPGETVPAKVEDYLGYDYEHNGKRAYEISYDASGNKRITVRQGKHIHLAASRDNQTSKERDIDGTIRGAFTHSFLKTLSISGGFITNKNLLNRTAALVKNLVADQQPIINYNGDSNGEEKNKLFLSQQLAAGKQEYLVVKDPKHNWIVRAGTMHGVMKGDKVIIEGVCETQVVASPSPDISVIFGKTELGSSDNQYFARIERMPNSPVSFSFENDVPAEIKSMIEVAAEKSAYVSFVKETTGQFIVRARDKEFFITRPGEEQPLFKPLQVTSADQAKNFIDHLEGISRWIRLQEFDNPSSKLTDEHYTLRIFKNIAPGNWDSSNFEEIKEPEAVTELYYGIDDGKLTPPIYRICITNNLPDKDLVVSCAYMGFDYSIDGDSFSPFEIGPGKTGWLNMVQNGLSNDRFFAELDERYAELGYSEITEYLKLFIGFQQIPTEDLTQSGIDLAEKIQPKKAAEKGIKIVVDKDAFSKNEWKTETIGLKIIKPSQAKNLIPGQSTNLQQLSIEQHPALEATINISSSESYHKEKGSLPAPHAANYNSYLEPYDLIPGIRSGSAMDILELVNVKGRESVTPDQPLVIQLPDTRSVEEELVLPIGYDPETHLYYPLGHMNESGKIVIETLPPDTPTNLAITDKSLLGSIKIYFQKVVGQKLGLKYNYPRLAKVTVTEDLKVTYEADSGVVKNEVEKAKTVILFIHGIIGDTEGMVKCIKTSLDSTGINLEKMADLVLAFDYENLNTKIEENAKLLRERLEAVGLKEGHGKNLIVIAHSMGGLVSRWFIEKLEGNKIVSKLVMLGTPNNGTPWADVRDMAEALLTYAINGAAFLKPWMFVLSAIGRFTKGTQVTLKQMDSKTGIYDELNVGTDPGLPYVVIAGNTRLIDPGFDNTASLIQRLFQRIKKKGVYDGLDLVLFKKPNDIAVSIESIETLKSSESWEKKPLVKTVASDHLNYFLTVEALKNIN